MTDDMDFTDIRERIEDLLNLGNLTKWEESFLMSLFDKADQESYISERELEKLSEIEDKS